MDGLDPVGPAAAEKEDCIAVWVQLEIILDYIYQAVQLLAHVCIAALSLCGDNAAYPHRIIILIFFETPLR